MILKQAPFWGRENFGEFLEKNYEGGIGVEIGTHRGEFAEQVLFKWDSCKKFVCYDPYITGYDNVNDPISRMSSSDRNEDYRVATSRLNGIKCCSIKTLTSEQALKYHTDYSIDFIHVDGNHQQWAVTFDLYSWYKKLKSGGIIAVHDYVCFEDDGGHSRSIQPAVHEFAIGKCIDVWLVVEKRANPWSCYMVKP